MKKYDVKAILEYAGITGKIRNAKNGDELRTICPFHEGRGFGTDNHPSLDINLKLGAYKCWSCGAKGYMPQLVVELGLVEYEFRNNFLEHFLLYDPDTNTDNLFDAIDIILKGNIAQEVKPELEKYELKYHKYLQRRKISEQTAKEFDIGFNKRLRRVIFPVYDIEDNLLFLSGRSVVNEFPRYLFTKDARVDKTLYNVNKFRSDKGRAILVEGFMDVIYLYQNNYKNVLGTMRTQFSDDQFMILKELGIKDLILFFDNDKAGKNFTNQFVSKYMNRFNIECVMDYSDKKDPQEMDVAELSKAIDSKQNYIEFYFAKGGMNTLEVPVV